MAIWPEFLIRSFNEQIYFDWSSDRRVRNRARAGRGVYTGCVARYRKLASASSSADRNSEGVAATSERPPSCDWESEWKRAFAIAKPGSVTCCRSNFAIPGRERGRALRYRRCVRCFIDIDCAGRLARSRRKCKWNRDVRIISYHRHFSCFIGAGNNFQHGSWRFIDPTDLDHVEVGDHDPQQRGFNARNIELAFDGAVDPYFEGFANIVFKLNNDNETEVEVEEAFLQTTSLPFNLQLKAGQFFAAFGRINAVHPHAWEFADAGIVSGRLLGPDGLRGVGTQISWIVPVPWYSQLILGVQNGRGGTGYSFRNPGDGGMFFDRRTTDRELRGLQDFVWIPRWENSVDLSPTQVVLAGVSGAFGSNETGANSRTQIYGADFLYKWKSANAEGGFPFVKWQTEFMYRRFEAGRGMNESFPIAETFHDWGMYSQVLWGFKKGWVAGIRGDYLDMEDSRFTDDFERQSRSRISANLTWYPTEFSKIRLQYNHDFLYENFFLADRDVDSVFLQFEFILGAHGAHKF